MLSDVSIKHRHILVDFGDKLLRLFVTTVFAACILPRRQVVPLGAARRFRIRRDDGHPGASQIIPILDLLRIAGPYEKHDRAGVRRGVMWQSVLPVGRNQFRYLLQSVDVTRQRQRHDIRRETVDNGASLFTGAAVRLLDGDVIARLGFVMGRERFVEFNIEFTRRIVGNVEELEFSGGSAGCDHQREQRRENNFRFHVTNDRESSRQARTRAGDG